MDDVSRIIGSVYAKNWESHQDVLSTITEDRMFTPFFPTLVLKITKFLLKNY